MFLKDIFSSSSFVHWCVVVAMCVQLPFLSFSSSPASHLWCTMSAAVSIKCFRTWDLRTSTAFNTCPSTVVVVVVEASSHRRWGKPVGYGVSPPGLHTGHTGRILSIENVLTTALSTGGKTPRRLHERTGVRGAGVPLGPPLTRCRSLRHDVQRSSSLKLTFRWIPFEVVGDRSNSDISIRPTDSSSSYRTIC